LNSDKNANSENLPEFYDEIDKKKFMEEFPNLTILQARAVDMLVGKIRDKTISAEEFRNFSRRIIRLIIEETLANECTEIIRKESPLGYYKTIHNPRDLDQYVGVSILRSGDSMVEELLTIMPNIFIGKILVQRDETTQEKLPKFFFEKLPLNINNKKILLLDPMLGTGGSATAAINILKLKGILEENIIFLNLISSPPGLEALFKKFPKIKIVTAKVDPLLLPNKYIAPGMGDFGDRFYGTLH